MNLKNLLISGIEKDNNQSLFIGSIGFEDIDSAVNNGAMLSAMELILGGMIAVEDFQYKLTQSDYSGKVGGDVALLNAELKHLRMELELPALEDVESSEQLSLALEAADKTSETLFSGFTTLMGKIGKGFKAIFKSNAEKIVTLKQEVEEVKKQVKDVGVKTVEDVAVTEAFYNSALGKHQLPNADLLKTLGEDLTRLSDETVLVKAIDEAMALITDPSKSGKDDYVARVNVIQNELIKFYGLRPDYIKERNLLTGYKYLSSKNPLYGNRVIRAKSVKRKEEELMVYSGIVLDIVRFDAAYWGEMESNIRSDKDALTLLNGIDNLLDACSKINNGIPKQSKIVEKYSKEINKLRTIPRRHYVYGLFFTYYLLGAIVARLIVQNVDSISSLSKALVAHGIAVSKASLNYAKQHVE